MTAEARAKLIEKFALGGGVSVGAAIFILSSMSPESVRAVASISWPSATFLMVVGGFVLVGRVTQIVDRRAAEGIQKIGEMADAVKSQALSVERFAKRDDEQQLRHEALLEETADRTRRILAWIEREEERRLGR